MTGKELWEGSYQLEVAIRKAADSARAGGRGAEEIVLLDLADLASRIESRLNRLAVLSDFASAIVGIKKAVNL